MPPKSRYNREQIIKAGVNFIRKNGVEAFSARGLGKELGCSPQPIFSCFASMEELKQAIYTDAYTLYLEYSKAIVESGRYPAYKSFGMGYIQFAMEEKQLFRMLFMRDRSHENQTMGSDWEDSVQIISEANGFTKAEAEQLHLEMWICVHGIATMAVTSFFPLEWEQISRILTDTYMGIRDRMKKGRECCDGSHQNS